MKKSPIHLLRGYLLSLMRTLRRFPLPTLFILLLTLKTLLALHGMSCGTGHEDDITFFYLSGAALRKGLRLVHPGSAAFALTCGTKQHKYNLPVRRDGAHQFL